MNEKEIQLHKLISSGNETEAIALLDSDDSIDVNFEYNQRIPIFSAINQKMYKLFEKIVQNPKFDSNVEDGFGENLLESLIYVYTADDLDSYVVENEYGTQNALELMIKAILNTKSFNFNHKDLNEDTAINIAAEYPKANWIVEALAADENVDINIVNDFDSTALTNAIRNKNTEAIKVLVKRSDLEVRDRDVEIASKYGVKLEDYGIDTNNLKVTEVEVEESAFAIACE